MSTGKLGQTPWVRQAALDKAMTGNGFSLLRGFEFTNDQENHLNVIGTSNWISRFAMVMSLSMLPFYAWLTTPPIGPDRSPRLRWRRRHGQFNHPGDGRAQLGHYKFNVKAAAQMATIEVRGGQHKSAYHLMHSDAGWYWHV